MWRLFFAKIAKSKPGTQLASTVAVVATSTPPIATSASSVRIGVASASAELRLIAAAATIEADQLGDLGPAVCVLHAGRHDVHRQVVVHRRIVEVRLVRV